MCNKGVHLLVIRISILVLFIYNKTSIKRNILTIKQNTSGIFSTSVYYCQRETVLWCRQYIPSKAIHTTLLHKRMGAKSKIRL